MKPFTLILILLLTGCASAPLHPAWYDHDCHLEIQDAKNRDIGWKAWDNNVLLPVCQSELNVLEQANERLLQDLVRCQDKKHR